MTERIKKPCTACGRGFFNECTKKVLCDVDAWLTQELGGLPVAEKTLTQKYKETLEPTQNHKGSTFRELKDPHSTGRKRAAKLYPLDLEAPCEWEGKKNCGGGRIPIVGCLGGKQQQRHHGPVKDTTRNQLGNVHRICAACHVHWHELNDLIYDPSEYGILPHDPDEATQEELAKNMIDWQMGEMKKRYTLASSVNKGEGKGDYRPPERIED